MLSQYSWWDLIKVVIVVLIVYYAYVLWAYYRQDIREWLSNRGQKSDTEPGTEQTDQEDAPSLYSVSRYGTVAPIAEEVLTQNITPVPTNQVPDLHGLALDQDEEPVFSMPLASDVERPAEQSVADLINAAQRVQADEQGVLIPNDPADSVAANLAEIINQQQGKSALSGISFNR